MTPTRTQPARLGIVELRLIFRRRTTLFSATVLPAALCALTWFTNREIPPNQWGALLGTRVLVLQLMSVFLVSATVYTARRQALVLKRLRTTELTDTGVIGGITAPIVALGLAQVLIYLGFCVAIGAPLPQHPLLVALAVILGVALSVAAGMATAALSRSVEATQITSAPLVVGALAGIFMQASGETAVNAAGVAMPLVGPADLLTKGWSGMDTGLTLAHIPASLPALISTLLWVAVFAVVIRAAFHWEPRR